jgi:CheY-like chemotaxis protein
MSVDFDFIGSSDKPALLAISTPEWQDTAKLALGELGYKVHVAGNHEDFLVRFGQVQYKMVIIEELFFSGSIEENQALLALQNMPMPQRRHAAICKWIHQARPPPQLPLISATRSAMTPMTCWNI